MQVLGDLASKWKSLHLWGISLDITHLVLNYIISHNRAPLTKILESLVDIQVLLDLISK